ncbi:anhydro-N-acetylmuramic acid kinase [uncultured Planktomarina sp.]|jgi:anhydro-N-acetylmuramic acid kinase|uniref:anhydro-N-acetylmuramic acid kinase n=1 Tax=uncultured Planktomarina sp. TaxID=1538529 RepID=UPI00326194A0
MGVNKPIWVTGFMSGTSLDGVDAACLLTDGVDICEFGPNAYRPYSAAERQMLQSALGKWPGAPGLEPVSELILAAHLEAWSHLPPAELIGFHGQTLCHDPQNFRTHQLGSGAEFARRAGTAVAWDFRSEDVACGGQGAPLAPIFHWALARYKQIEEPMAIVNLGGVGNLTWIDARLPAEQGLLAFDTGPANAPLNDFMVKTTGQPYDAGGALAASGRVDEELVALFLQRPYFSRAAPKSLDRDSFSDMVELVAQLAPADAAATLTGLCVASIEAALPLMPVQPKQVWISGGGRKNSEIMRQLTLKLPMKLHDIDDIGLDGDMLEAQAFAYLAARVARGRAPSFPATTATKAPLCGGKISLP